MCCTCAASIPACACACMPLPVLYVQCIIIKQLEVFDHISGLVDLYIFLVLSVDHLVIMYLTNSFKL